MTMQKLNLTIRRGASSDIPIRIETDELIYRPITAMTNGAPLQITAPAHGLPNGWRAAIQNAGGSSEINLPWDRLRDADLRKIAWIDADHFTFPEINSSAWRAYTSGGQVVYYQPLDLSAFSSASMDVRAAVGESLLAHYSTAAGTLEIDTANSAIWMRLSVTDTESMPAADLVFDIELTRSAGGVIALCTPDSTLTVLPEVTTT